MDENKVLNQLIEKISVGKTILFAGVAFSKDSININNTSLPLSSELSKQICDLGSFPQSDDLRYSADRYLTENQEQSKQEKLIKLLKSNYNVKNPSIYAKKIMQAPWNKFYTTNYDNTIEKIYSEIIPVDLSCSLDKLEIKDKRCVHLNGYISNLNIKSLEKSFKLTEASYLSYDGFLESPWFAVFKRDLERCSALVFIGYSLYDLDIKRMIINISNLKDNTYFILNENIDEKEKFLFNKY